MGEGDVNMPLIGTDWSDGMTASLEKGHRIENHLWCHDILLLNALQH